MRYHVKQYPVSQSVCPLVTQDKHSYPHYRRDSEYSTVHIRSHAPHMPKGASLLRCVSVSKLSVLQCIQSIIGEESYRQDTVNQWTAKIVEQALTLLVKQTKSYKYIGMAAFISY